MSLMIRESARKIFRTSAKQGNLREGRKIAQRPPRGPAIMSYLDNQEKLPRSFDPVFDYKKEKLQILKDTNRTPPEKGGGKRAK